MYTSTMETVQAVAECHATNGWGALTSVRSFGSALQEMLGNVPEGGLVLTNQTPWACPDTPVGVDPSPTDHQDKEGEREVDPITSTSSPHGQPHACVRAVRVSTRYLPPGRFRILPTTLTRAPEQSALDAVDTFCSPKKQFALLDLTLTIYDLGAALIDLGVPVQELQDLPMLAKARRCKSTFNSDQIDAILAFHSECEQALEQIRLEYAKQGDHA